MGQTLTRDIYHYGRGGAPVEVDMQETGAQLTLTQDNATVLGPVPVAVAPVGLAVKHVLSYTLPDPLQAPLVDGEATALWEFTEDSMPKSVTAQVTVDSSGGPGIFPTRFDVAAMVRLRLGVDNELLPDEPLQAAIGFVGRLLMRQLRDFVPSYLDIQPEDAYDVDFAISLLASVYLRPLTPKAGPSGELIMVQIGTDKFQYSDIGARSSAPLDPLEVQWANEAWDILLGCTFADDWVETMANAPSFAMAGPRRNARARLSLSDTLTPDYNLLGDASSQWAWSRRWPEC